MKPKREDKEPWKTIKNGSVEVVIYKEAAGHRIVWYFGGIRERKFKVDEAKAVSFAKKQAASLGSAQPVNAAEIDAKLRYLAQLEEAMEGVPVHVAVNYYKQHNARQKLVPERLDKLFPEFLQKLREDQKSPSYITAIDDYVSPYVEAFPGKIDEQNSVEIDKWMRKRTKSLHSREHFIEYLRTVFNWARDVKKALPKGETEADLVATPEPKAGPIEIYTPQEMRLFLKFAKNDGETALLALGGFVGLRNSEITGDRTAHGPLLIEKILFDASAIEVTQKAQQESITRYAPIPENALTWLEPLRGKHGPVVKFDDAAAVLHAIIDRVNAAHADKPGWTPIKFKRNGLRRSHISYRMAITRDAAKVGDECNTSPAKIRKNYRKPGLEGVAHEYYSISRLMALPAPSGPLPAIGGATPSAQSAES